MLHSTDNHHQYLQHVVADVPFSVIEAGTSWAKSNASVPGQVINHRTTLKGEAPAERWSALMEADQNGDQKAYRQLLTEILPLLRRVVGRKWRDTNEVEDIVQEILISVHNVRQAYDPDRAFLPWLMTITKRRIADAARRNASRQAHETTVDVMPEILPGDDPALEANAVGIQNELRYAMSFLSASQKEAVELVKMEGLSFQEASVRTGKSIPSLKVAVHRAMKIMRNVLEQ